MTLATVVTARLSNERLVQLTNPDAQAATTADSVRLGLACADAAAEFEVLTGTAFNEADPRHLGPAVDLVALILKEYGSAPADTLGRERERVEERLKALSLVTGRNRILPETAQDTAETFPQSVFEHTLLDPQPPEDEDA